VNPSARNCRDGICKTSQADAQPVGFFFEVLTMRLWELVRFVFSGLRRQKARTALTLMGVSVGACALSFSLALGLGLRGMIAREFRSRASFWEVQVMPKNQGEMMEASKIPPEELLVPDSITGERRERLRTALIIDYQRHNRQAPPKPLTHESVEAIERIPNVKSVVAGHSEFSNLVYQDKSTSTYIGTFPLKIFRLEPYILHGTQPTDDDGDSVVISEHMLFKMGCKTDADFESCLGKPLTVTLGKSSFGKSSNAAFAFGLNMKDLTSSQEKLLDKIAQELPKTLDKMDLDPLEKRLFQQLLATHKTKPKMGRELGPESVTHVFRIGAVKRELSQEELKKQEARFDFFTGRCDVFLPANTGRKLFEQFPEKREQGYYTATVQVEPGSDLRTVVTEIESQGFRQYSALEWYDSVMMEVTMIAGGLNLFALVSLFVAGLGITNTLATSVVERTREIGILKAVGATKGQILRLFLLEGTAIGLIGGCLGMLTTYLLSFPGDTIIGRMVETQSQGRLKASTVFEFPIWLPLATIGFTLVATSVAAYFPARRASRMLPVEALRAV
jgi:putative ABC transport system permease protein